MDWITTSTILQDLADFSNQSAWERFATRFRSPIVNFARRMGLSEADAEDTAQETLVAFAEAYRQGRYDRTKGRLSQWLFGIAFRQALSERRGAARRARLTAQANGSSFGADVVDDAAAKLWDQEWEQALLQTCLLRARQEVEPTTFRAFELLMREGRTPADVAAELRVPVKSVYNAKYTVLKRMRELRAGIEDSV